jgi:hypothetical protein
VRAHYLLGKRRLKSKTLLPEFKVRSREHGGLTHTEVRELLNKQVRSSLRPMDLPGGKTGSSPQPASLGQTETRDMAVCLCGKKT